MPIRLPTLLLVLFAGLAACEIGAYLGTTAPLYSDFFGLWSWSRFAGSAGAAALYDPAALHDFQRALDPLYAGQHYPFLYPPTYLLFIAPLGHLGLGTARLLWSAATLAAFLLALGPAGRRPRLLALAAVAPATVLCLICGQNGLLTAALMLGGLRLGGRQPLCAGLLLGLLTYKPHLALLVPVALIAAGLWRSLAAMAATAVASAAATMALFGTEAWRAWAVAQRSSWGTIDAFIGDHAALVPTVTAALRQLGAPGSLVTGGQAAACLLAVAGLWAVWRRSEGADRLLAAPVAALLATPYAFLYDLPMLTGGVLLVMAEAGASSPLLVTALLLPQIMFAFPTSPIPFAAPVLLLLVSGLLLRSRDWRNGPAGSRREPCPARAAESSGAT